MDNTELFELPFDSFIKRTWKMNKYELESVLSYAHGYIHSSLRKGKLSKRGD